MLNVRVNSADLQRWSRFLEQVPRKGKAALARAINAYGKQVVRSAAEAISEQTDLQVDDIMDLIEVSEATPENIVWSMDASAVTPAASWERPWDQRETSEFGKQALVKIVTAEDEAVCPVCEEAAANSPYSIDEINVMKAKWKDYEPPTNPLGREYTNLVHPRCRCLLQSWSMTRRLPVNMGAGHTAPRELLNARQLGARVAAELKVELKVV